jgi:peptidoglycan/xylan/chitin deacetylase (PgdA/CDA1 family)
MTDRLALCYHALSRDWPAELSTTPERFAAQLELLRGAGWRGVTFAELAAAGGRGRMVAVTFDDAFASVVEHAVPVLDALGWPATVFAPTDPLDADAPLAWAGTDRWLGTPFEGELAPARWEQLAALARRGWEIGSHTRTHPRLTSVPDDRLGEELAGSKDAVELRIGAPCRTIAYPYGDVDERVAMAARAAGYAAAAALPRRLHAPRAHEWPRVGVYHKDDLRRFRLKVARGRRWVETAASALAR